MGEIWAYLLVWNAQSFFTQQLWYERRWNDVNENEFGFVFVNLSRENPPEWIIHWRPLSWSNRKLEQSYLKGFCSGRSAVGDPPWFECIYELK